MNLLYAAHVPAGDQPLCTIVAIHGLGSNAHDLLSLAPLLHGGEALVLCPEGPEIVPIGPGMQGHAWFPMTGGGPPDEDAFERAVAALEQFVEAALDRYPIRRDRVLLLGFSQGGVVAYRLFLEHPERYAGLVALSSWLPEKVARSIPKPDVASDRPVLVMHGTRDPLIEVARARESRRRLLALELPLTYREYDMAHEISQQALRDLQEWIEDKVFTPVHLL